MANANPYPVFDGHNDVLFELYYPASGGGRTFFERSERGHIDLPRAIEGGFGIDAGLVAVALDRGDHLPEPVGARAHAIDEVRAVERADQLERIATDVLH